MYYDDYEEFYDNYNEFDQQITEFQDGLKKGVKEEFLNEMKRLKKENSELQEVKENFEKIKAGYKEKERELKLNESTIERRMRSAKLSELMKDIELVMYKVNYKYFRKSKCDKCNEIRQIYFKSPSGKDITEYCECSTQYKVYYPSEFSAYEFRINYNKTSMSFWFKNCGNSEDEYYERDSVFVEYLYTQDMKFEDINTYRTFFKSKKDCQKYCDWLNKENEGLNLEPINLKKSI